MKNIPIGNEKMVVTRMYGMAAKFINRMRWKAHWFSGEETTENQCDDGAIYRFPSKKSAPKSEHLTPFENDLYDAIKKLKFRKFSNDFQSRLKNDARKIRESKELLISADKTTNIYKVPPCEYKSLITKAINRDYRKAPADALNKINDDAMDIIEKNKIKGRIPKYEQKEAFITIKDHKAGFPTTVKCKDEIDKSIKDAHRQSGQDDFGRNKQRSKSKIKTCTMEKHPRGSVLVRIYPTEEHQVLCKIRYRRFLSIDHIEKHHTGTEVRTEVHQDLKKGRAYNSTLV